MDRKTSHWEQRKDPRWQKKRLTIMKRDKFRCKSCHDKTSSLNVHHRWYVGGRRVWEYPDIALVTLCQECHESETEFSIDFSEDGFSWEKIAALIIEIERDNMGWGLGDNFDFAMQETGLSAKDILTVILSSLSSTVFSKQDFIKKRNNFIALKKRVAGYTKRGLV